MPTLLIVDDIPGIHDMLDLVFEDSGFSLEHALQGAKALELYQSKEIDVVLSDIQMPGMNGLELFRELKQIDPAVTMVMTTASESRDFVIQALRLGAFDYVEKPYDEADLIATVRRAWEERQKRLSQDSGGGASMEELETLRRELAARDAAIASVTQKDAEIEQLRQELAAQKDQLKASEQKRKELDKARLELEVREGALQTMETVLKERMAKLKEAQQQQQAGGGLSAKDSEKLAQLQARLEQREAELQEMEAGIREREEFISQTEESLMDKGMRLQEIEAELEQMREDITKGGGGGGGMSAEAQEEMAAMKEKLAEKEEALRDLEEKMRDKERGIKKAEALIKAREQFLAQSEAILLGGDQS